MEADAGEFQDWELLHHTLEDSATDLKVDESDDGVGVEGMIQTNYFSLDTLKSDRRSLSGPDVSEAGSEASDNPSWIDPGLETRYPRKYSAESWSDSGSDPSDDRKLSEFEGKTDMGSVQNEKLQVGFEGVKEIEGENEKNSDLSGEPRVLGEDKLENEGQSVVGEMKKCVAWWKVPMEFVKYCAFRVSPGWALSVAAAFVGFVILGRKLYKMKKKSRALELKVTMDDKKISQFMSRAARLNEAFSVVRRVPVIRPSLPAVGVSPWPVVSMR